MIIKFVVAEWWFMYGNQTPTLRKLTIKVLSQIASSSVCERNWSTFALIHTKQRNRLAYPRLEQLVFCYYNMRLKLHDMEAEMIELLKKITLIFLTFQPRWVKKKIISYSSGLGLYTWMTKLEILIHELPLMLENLELMLNVCYPKKFTLKVLAKILMIHFMRHCIPTKRLTPQVLAIVVDLVL